MSRCRSDLKSPSKNCWARRYPRSPDYCVLPGLWKPIPRIIRNPRMRGLSGSRLWCCSRSMHRMRYGRITIRRSTNCARAGSVPGKYIRPPWDRWPSVAEHITPKPRAKVSGVTKRYTGIHKPTSLDEVKALLISYRQHYNQRRPHQAKPCHRIWPRKWWTRLC